MELSKKQIEKILGKNISDSDYIEYLIYTYQQLKKDEENGQS
ncbi:hypothetical protein [Paenibacillus sp. XY044]|nr:hypothetical protein [Paenibacillus sp. XY044]